MSNIDQIEHFIELNPHRPGLDEARLRDSGVPVWALIGYLPAVDGDIVQLAADYELPIEAIQAAIQYYQQHRSVIDARIAANSADEPTRLHAA